MILQVTNPSNPAEEGPSRDRLPLRAFCHALSGPILFGGTAIAACDAEFACGLAAVLCGATVTRSTGRCKPAAKARAQRPSPACEAAGDGESAADRGPRRPQPYEVEAWTLGRRAAELRREVSAAPRALLPTLLLPKGPPLN
jgi:hypothetical protein